ncbi:ATP-binding protein [Gilliamella apicola]|uniref:ATP-binding protein n=1 Tax=Gilliamella apicola TaxID=1196095 RepID=UPI000A344108|nr:ATP-binding protein [Gilliamella apicola]OTP95960.1 ATPase [Gilliamella apicola]OTQ03386.1 ATPase [Gilliamella apicola]OTQ31335.1 ATPase [Gilliamella apicola]
MTEFFIDNEAVLRIGEVVEVSGRNITILVDKNKNLSDLFFNGKVLRNVSVNSFIEIKKGFLSLIVKIESEKIIEDKNYSLKNIGGSSSNRYLRFLTTSLLGFIDNRGIFVGGTREFPLIGNEAFIVTEPIIQCIHNITNEKDFSINFAKTDLENIDISIPVDGLLNSHIAIFGNTGSGKSNTLAALYKNGYETLKTKIVNNFHSKCRFLLFDFNGEYISNDCITPDKKVYNLSTHTDMGDKIPIPKEMLLEHEMLSILSSASEKAQKPFLKRVLDFYTIINATTTSTPIDYFRSILKNCVKKTLTISDKVKADTIFDFFRPLFKDDDLTSDLEFNFKNKVWTVRDTGKYIDTENDAEQTKIYKSAEKFTFATDLLDNLLQFMYLKLIQEMLSNRSEHTHISPVINRLISNRKDIRKIFDTSGAIKFWAESNFIVINLNMVNLTMKKILPLLISRWAYNNKKQGSETSSLSFIIDEAHNILSSVSNRESESWKDYRLETFEEIIKEGRKFGVFVTISSQRPNDISPTIISQAHNYFIHRLINQNDLFAIQKAVSYIDKVSEESIPTLPRGTCIFSGVLSQMPLKLRITELDDKYKPKSNTLSFNDFI